MKFNLTVTDLGLEEVTAVLTKISAGMPVSLTPVAAAPAPEIPAAPVAALQPQPVAAPAAAPAFDSTGLPWDERIHAGTKAVNADGTWKKRRGVQEIQVNQVEAELRAQVGAAPVAAPQPVYPQPAPMPVAAAPAVDPLTMFGPLPAAAPQPAPVMPQPVYPQPAPMPVAAAPAVDPRIITAPVAAPQARTFEQLMGTIQGLFNQQLIAPDYMVSLNQRLGVSAITDLAGSPERIEQAFGLLKADGKIQ